MKYIRIFFSNGADFRSGFGQVIFVSVGKYVDLCVAVRSVGQTKRFQVKLHVQLCIFRLSPSQIHRNISPDNEISFNFRGQRACILYIALQIFLLINDQTEVSGSGSRSGL